MDEITKILTAYKLRCSPESALQQDVAKVLRLAQIEFQAEHRFDGRDRVDFWLPGDGIAIECKVEGGKTPIFSQLLRYAEHPEVKRIILVTTRAKHRWPNQQLGGKSFSVVYVGGVL